MDLKLSTIHKIWNGNLMEWHNGNFITNFDDKFDLDYSSNLIPTENDAVHETLQGMIATYGF